MSYSNSCEILRADVGAMIRLPADDVQAKDHSLDHVAELLVQVVRYGTKADAGVLRRLVGELGVEAEAAGRLDVAHELAMAGMVMAPLAAKRPKASAPKVARLLLHVAKNRLPRGKGTRGAGSGPSRRLPREAC